MNNLEAFFNYSLMKLLLYSFLILYCFASGIQAQNDQEITSMDFVQVLHGNTEEAIYYYENNWKQLRVKALEKGYIKSYKLLQVTETNAEFQIVLQTTYANKQQFEKREAHFQELIKAQGSLKLLNEKTPKDFRKTVFWSDTVGL